MKTLETIYSQPGRMTYAGEHARLLSTLPRDLPGLVAALQGLLIHEYMLGMYGASVPEVRKQETHLRGLDTMLANLQQLDPRPLTETRKPTARAIGVCRHFTVLLVGALRAQGIPARARVGFASYFNRGTFEDHWLGEYWNAVEQRWISVDAQLDSTQRNVFGTDFDPLDVPRDRFLIAADAWQRYRRGELAPEKFGIMDLRGAWFIAGNLIRDLAALNAVELLPWDAWGAMPSPAQSLTPEELQFFDRIAQLTAAPEENLHELPALYTDARVKVGDSVFNSRLQTLQTID
jgi:hypothetical protein